MVLNIHVIQLICVLLKERITFVWQDMFMKTTTCKDHIMPLLGIQKYILNIVSKSLSRGWSYMDKSTTPCKHFFFFSFLKEATVSLSSII